MDLSIVIPAYGTRSCIAPLTEEIKNAIPAGVEYEVIFIDDGCPQNSWEAIVTTSVQYSFVKGIKLSRNFGQHYAITAGISKSSGDIVIVMDCDLQDDPSYIPEFMKMIKSGHDIVYSLREKRSFGYFKNFSAKIYYIILSLLGRRIENSENIGTLTAFTSNIRSYFLMVNDRHRHFLLILKMLGFKSNYIKINHRHRKEGKSSYNVKKLVIHALDGIISQSNKLLTLSIYSGFIFCLFSSIWGFYLCYQYFRFDIPAGYTSLMVGILFSSGLIMAILGIHGLYLGKIFDQARERPMFIIQKEINFR